MLVPVVVNLRQARKQRQRDEKRERGDENAARHGEAKPDRTARLSEDRRTARLLDGHRLNEAPDA